MNAAAVLLLSTLLSGSWGGGGCARSGAPMMPSFAPTMNAFMQPALWAQRGSGANCSCSPQCTCGCQQGGSCTCADSNTAASNTAAGNTAAAVDLLRHPGVVTERLHPAREQILLNGEKPLTRGQYIEALHVGGLADDSNQLFVCYRSADEASALRFYRDFDTAPELAEFRGQVRVQAYPPGKDALVAKDRDGKPLYDMGLAIVAPDGRELHRSGGYDNALTLATALRKARDDYDKNKTPDLTRPFVPLPGLAEVPLEYVVLLVGVAAIAVALFYHPKKG